MGDPTLSIVIPVYNEAASLPDTIEALVVAAGQSRFAAEVVLVDDGSTDGSAGIAERTVAGRLPFSLVAQRNLGRFKARRAGLETASGELVLFLDARVRLLPGALAFLDSRVRGGETVWNGHVYVEAADPLGRFWRLLAELAWREYFDAPRTTSFGIEEFDRYPKGTTCFLAPRELLLEAFAVSRSRYADARLGN